MKLSSELKSLIGQVRAHREAQDAEAARIAAEPGGCVLVQYRRMDGSPIGALLSRDPDGGWRMTRFDADGMSGHACCADKYAAALEALRSGYADTDRELLHKLQADRARFFAHVWEH